MSEFEFKDVLFIGPADDSEEADKSREFVNWLVENKVLINWKPFDFSSSLDDELQNKLKKIKNILLNSSQIIIDDEVKNWKKRVPAVDLSQKTILATFNEESFNAETLKLINNSFVDFVIVENKEVLDLLQEQKCSKKLLLKPKFRNFANSNLDHHENIILGEGWYCLENYQTTSHRWTNSESFIQIKEKYYDYIDIETFCDFIDRKISIEVKENIRDEFVEIFSKKYKKNSLIKLSIPLKKNNFIKINSGEYSPDSDDTRILGLKIKEFILTKGKNKFIKKISSFKDNHTFIFNQIIIN